MNNLNSALYEIINDVLNEASLKLSEKFNIPIDEIGHVWNTLKLTSSYKQKENINEEISGCTRILTRVRVGECCGKKISKKSETGKYCTTHLSHERETKKPKVDEFSCNYRFNKSKFGNYTHSTGLAIRSQTNKKIYGREDKDGIVQPLTEEDIELCKKFRFVYEKNEKEKYEDDLI